MNGVNKASTLRASGWIRAATAWPSLANPAGPALALAEARESSGRSRASVAGARAARCPTAAGTSGPNGRPRARHEIDPDRGFRMTFTLQSAQLVASRLPTSPKKTAWLAHIPMNQLSRKLDPAFCHELSRLGWLRQAVALRLSL